MNEVEKDKANMDKIKVLEEMVHEKDNQIFQLKTILDQVPGNIYWKNKEGIYLGLNATGMESLRKKGFIAKESDVIGKTDNDVYLKETADAFRKNDVQVIQTGKEMVTEEAALLPSGEKIIQLSTKRPLWDQAGEIIGIIGNTINITSLKKVESDLRIANKIDVRQTEFFYNNILSKLPTNVYWKDKDSIYRGCNDRLANALGLSSREDINGKTDFDFDWGREGAAESFIEFDKKVMHTQQALTTEDVFKEANGQFVTVLTTKTPLKDEKNQVIGVLAISVDITEKKKAEQELKEAKEKAEHLSQAKSEFIANMSHDVKTPLAGIMGLSELLKKTLRGQDVDFIQGILQASQQLLNFFENCLEIAKTEGMPITQVKECFDVKDLLSQIHALFQPALQDKHLSFHIHYDETLPTYVRGSRAGLYRIILNLISNAIKFTEKGGIRITVKGSHQSAERKAIISFIVEDTGMGIPEDKQKVIFERFTRLVPSYTGVYEGNGIGLHLVERFAKAMEGEIYVSSVVGQGSKFTVVLPLGIPLLDEQEYQETHVLASLSTLSSPEATLSPSFERFQEKISLDNAPLTKKQPRILVVEDNVIVQLATQNLLHDLECQVDMAPDGKKALEFFKSQPYDLILMDIGLPDISGIAVTEAIRKLEKDSVHGVPIIALSAHVTEAIQKDCLTAGMNEAMSKPLSKEVMERLIKQYM